MTPGQVVTITVHVFITQDGGTLDNEACVDPNNTIPESNELDNCNHAVTDIVPAVPDLRISKSADKSTVTPGDSLSYKVTVSNSGNAATTDGSVTFTDTLPAAVTFQQASATNGFTCTHSGATPDVVTCTGGDLNPGDETTATIDVTVNSNVTKPFTNKASVNVATGETNTANNGPVSLSTSVGGSGFDLAVTKIVDNPDPVNAIPSALEYTITAQNNGTETATGAVVRVKLPQTTGISNIAVAGSNGFICTKNTTVDASGHTYDCVGDFTGGGTTVITADMTVNPGAPNTLQLTATADPDNAFGESDETNNSLTEVTTVSGTVCTSTPCTDLVVSSLLDTPDPVDTGGTVTYTASVVNTGDTPTNPSTLWEMRFVYAGNGTPTVTAPAGITCALPNPLDPDTIVCTGSSGSDPMDLGPGAGIDFTVTVTGVSPTSGSTVSLTATADSTNLISEFTETNNSLTENTTVNP